MLLIREATPADAALLVNMIRELADFEKELDQVEATPEDIVREGFTGSPGFHALIAEWDGRPVAYAVYFFTFSTWAGKQSMFVEDLFVREEFRRKGIGRGMLCKMAAIAQERKCYGMRWEVLNWNKSAIEFYRSLGATLQTEWFPVLLQGEAFEAFAAKK
jgi:GNAT superfamily N-acetyltransferase